MLLYLFPVDVNLKKKGIKLTMSIKILNDYLELCEGLNICPSVDGLKAYKQGLEKNIIIVK